MSRLAARCIAAIKQAAPSLAPSRPRLPWPALLLDGERATAGRRQVSASRWAGPRPCRGHGAPRGPKAPTAPCSQCARARAKRRLNQPLASVTPSPTPSGDGEDERADAEKVRRREAGGRRTESATAVSQLASCRPGPALHRHCLLERAVIGHGRFLIRMPLASRYGRSPVAHQRGRHEAYAGTPRHWKPHTSRCSTDAWYPCPLPRLAPQARGENNGLAVANNRLVG